MSNSYPFWLGGVAASMAAACTHPLDVTKVRMQTLETAAGTKRPSTLSVIRNSISSSGFRSLYTGLSASLLRQMSYSLVRIGAYEKFKSSMDQPSSPQLLMAAAIAGGLGGLTGNPADILLVRMTTDVLRPPQSRYGYSNALSGLWSLLKKEGARGLARGLVPNTTRAVLMNASQVGSYDLFKSTLLAHPIPLLNYQLQDNLLLHAIASGLAGAFATSKLGISFLRLLRVTKAVCSPADVLKSRLMSSSSKHGLIHVLRSSLREEGFIFLFKGWSPAFLRLGPNTVLLFVFFEQLKQGWSRLSD